MNEFKTLAEAFTGFKRNAISDLTPPKISSAIEGGFYAGAQATLVLLAEGLKIDPVTAPREVVQLFAECQTFFELARVKAKGRLEEKRGKRNG